MSGTDRRKYERVDMKFKVELSSYDPSKSVAAMQTAQSRNTSDGGLLVTTDIPVEISSYVIARFSLPDNPMQKEVIAKVVRVDELESFAQYDIGLEFVKSLSDIDKSSAE